jgi:hypothetical protein
MVIFLLIWLLFLILFIAINIYGIYRILSMRIRGDIVPIMTIGYLIVVVIIIGVSIAFIASLDWPTGFLK